MNAPPSKIGGSTPIPRCTTRVQEIDVSRERETVSLS